MVILNHLCYASGNSEPGRANPTKSVAMQRVDDFGAGFLRAGARAVFANGKDSVASIITALLTTNQTMAQIFQARTRPSRDAPTSRSRRSGPAATRPGWTRTRRAATTTR